MQVAIKTGSTIILKGILDDCLALLELEFPVIQELTQLDH